MKIFVLIILVVIYTNACCKETEFDGYSQDEVNSNNLTAEESMFAYFMQPQKFTVGTLLGLLVASLVVVIGSFLVMWRLCCDVEMVVTREVMEPLQSISQKVANNPRAEGGRSASGELLLSQSSSSSVLEIE
ncbi:uncharacterized protein LOC129229877 [Uloborus diversus]|uniref:uncharacterized protein LOC129229877 n=1 Tax=Uloborus diversus TaxID=327109 RepID=UPI002409A248|nr:uncharacterized protein LOC129229877 [Uloborus diversus]